MSTLLIIFVVIFAIIALYAIITAPNPKKQENYGSNDIDRLREKQLVKIQDRTNRIQEKINNTSTITNDLTMPVHIAMELDDQNIVYSSPVHKSVLIGNFIFYQKYDEAIELGEDLLKNSPNDSMLHINLMMAYFKIRNRDISFFDKSTYHAKQAIICGHNTGFAHKRLVINLEKSLKINQAIQLCDLILSDDFSFCTNGCGSKEEFLKRKVKLITKADRAVDSLNDSLFTKDEFNKILYDNN